MRGVLVWAASTVFGVAPAAPATQDLERLRQAQEAWRLDRDVHALGALLGEVASRSGGLARVVSLGTGREGRGMPALEVGPSGAPGVVIVPASVHAPGCDVSRELDGMLEVARACVAAGQAGGPHAGLLREHRLVFAFGARPDLCAPPLAPLDFDPLRNYPVDADLASRAGGGPYPLRAAEARALAHWLDADPALFAAVVLGAAPLDRASLATGDTSSDQEQERLLALPVLAQLGAAAPSSDEPMHGGFARHARLRAGLAVLALPLGADVGHERVLVGALAELLASAPRLELVLDPRTRPVGEDLWQLDVVIANVGGLATGTSIHAHERRPRGIALTAPGDELVLAAARTGNGAYTVVDVGRAPDGRPVLRLGDLPAGGRLELRIVVRSAGERPIELAAVTPRGLAVRSFVTPTRER